MCKVAQPVSGGVGIRTQGTLILNSGLYQSSFPPAPTSSASEKQCWLARDFTQPTLQARDLWQKRLSKSNLLTSVTPARKEFEAFGLNMEKLSSLTPEERLQGRGDGLNPLLESEEETATAPFHPSTVRRV